LNVVLIKSSSPGPDVPKRERVPEEVHPEEEVLPRGRGAPAAGDGPQCGLLPGTRALLALPRAHGTSGCTRFSIFSRYLSFSFRQSERAKFAARSATWHEIVRINLLNIWFKQYQKLERNIPRRGIATVPMSTFMCLLAIYIIPRSICLFCCRKYVNRS
jgi:hypothetical protein